MKPHWRAFRQWHADVRPDRTVIGGDFLDLEQLSTFPKDPRNGMSVIPEIREFVREANALAAECGELHIVEGNHESRWSRRMQELAAALFGAVGLTLKDQCFAQGLSRDVHWHLEDKHFRGIAEGQMLIRHGHNDAGRFGGGKHIASNLIEKTLGRSITVGHHHTVQMICRRRDDGKLAIGTCNGTFEEPADFAMANPWVYGFTVYERCSSEWSTPHPIVIENGVFAYGGKVYDGNAETHASAPDTDSHEVAHIPSDVMLPSSPPIPFYHPRREDSSKAQLDRFDSILNEMREVRSQMTSALNGISEAEMSLDESDAPLEHVSALPPPAPEPREEKQTRDDHGTSRGRIIKHPVTGEERSLVSWARALGLPRTTLQSRLESPKYTLVQALTPSYSR